MDADEEKRPYFKQLRNCKKYPKKSIHLHAAKWYVFLSLIEEYHSKYTKIQYFIQSLDQEILVLHLYH